MPNNMIEIDVSQLNMIGVALRGFENQIPPAVTSALNRTVDFVYTRVSKNVTKQYEIKAGDVKGTLTKHKANRTNLEAHVKSSGGTLSLSHFKFTPRKVGTRRQVRIRIKKFNSSKSININPQAFVQMIGGKLNVFAREGEDRFPIKTLKTLSVPQMVENTTVEQRITQEAQEKLGERIEHEIWYRLQRQRRP